MKHAPEIIKVGPAAIVDRLASLLTVGKVTAFFVGCILMFGAYVIGARTIEPRVEALEVRVVKIDLTMEKRGERLSEALGYLRAIADRLDVKRSDIKIEGENE